MHRPLRTLARIAFGVSLVLTPSLSGCRSSEPPPPAPATADERVAETERLSAFFEEIFQQRLARSPQRQSYMGLKRDYDKWDDNSPERANEDYELVQQDLERLRSEFDPARVDPAAALSWRLFEYESEDELGAYRWRLHNYPVNQMFGQHSGVVSFLINVHRVDSLEDAQAYVARLAGIGPVLDQLRANLLERQSLGILPPRFVYPMVIDDCRNIVAGAPFAQGVPVVGDADAPDSTLLADLRAKLEALESLSSEQRDALLAEAEHALVEYVEPAYAALIRLLEEQKVLATDDDGIWKLPYGSEYYAWLLRHYTTTNLSADDIHTLGLAEVNRIHGEMRAIMDEVEFEGDLQAFFDFLRDDDRFYYPDTDEGRLEYLTRAENIIRAMERRLDELFLTKPKSELIVKAVEPYRAATAGKAFYNRGAPDGSRPGIYYANLYAMRDMPTYQMEALAYHEGIPGHHMQGSIAMELEGIPRFRRYGSYTSYGEGWGLYTEKLPKEMGFYDDPYSDFGRLAMELWRACRLVVDTGIHHHHWTRQQAIDYLRVNTPNPDGDCINAIERYIVMPGQATAYTVGMLEILRLREEAQTELGDAFDLREFHEVVLTNGPVPLSVLDELVDDWATSKPR